MEMPSDRSDDPLAFAAAYPFDIPAFSYVFVGGEARRLVPTPAAFAAELGGGEGEGPDADGAARVAVIACGSNRAPSQLRRKFADFDGVVIPMIRGRLFDFDVVYSAHFTRYGAIPATLCPSPGTRAEVSVARLTRAQIAALHASESLGLNYAFGRLGGLRLELETAVSGHRVLSEAFCYRSLHGCLVHSAQPVGLAAVAVQGRAFPALHQIEALRLARDRLSPGSRLDAFVAGVVSDEELRGKYVRLLADGAHRFEWPGFHAIEA
jgi:hypothetical protein